jgi:serine/threonine protein kinase
MSPSFVQIMCKPQRPPGYHTSVAPLPIVFPPGQSDLSRLTHLPEAHDLISKMVAHEPAKRPKTRAVLEHPLFQSDEARLSFLQVGRQWGPCARVPPHVCTIYRSTHASRLPLTHTQTPKSRCRERLEG